MLLRGADGAALGLQAARARESLLAGQDAAAVATRSLFAPPDRYIAALLAPDPATLVRELEAAERFLPKAVETNAPWRSPRGSFFVPSPPEGRVAFVYPGTFATYPGAGRDLTRLFPGLRPPQDLDLAALTADGLTEDLGRLVAAGVCIGDMHTRALRDVLGIRPHGGLGYSLGELSMLCGMDVMSAERADAGTILTTPVFREQLHGRCEVVRAAWNLPEGLPDAEVWASFVVFADADRVRQALHGRARAFLTHVNTPREVVIAGAPGECRKVIADLGCPGLEVAKGGVLHTPVIDPVVADLEVLTALPPGVPDPAMELFSASDPGGFPLADRHGTVRRVVGMLRNEVDFRHLVETAYARGFRWFIDVGPGTDAGRWIGETLGDRPHLVFPADRRGTPAATNWLRLLAGLAGAGMDLDPNKVVAFLATAAPGSVVVEHAAEAPAAGENGSWERAPQEKTMERNGVSLRAHDGAGPFVQLGATVAAAHRSALRLQSAIAERSLLALEQDRTPVLEPPRQQPPANAYAAPESDTSSPSPSPEVIWTEADMVEFSTGKVANVFGPEYAAIDEMPARVRIPAPPYQFISRVTELRATPGKFEPSSITTEYDVPENAWYSVDGKVPIGVLLEAGQSSLLLVSYLGVDFRARGRRVFRLLGGTAVFHDRLPAGGETMRYEVTITRFVWRDDQLMYFFDARCYVGDRLILEGKDGCAGLFTYEELAEPQGVIITTADQRRLEQMTRSWFKPLAETERTALTRGDLEALAAGKPGTVFGPAFDQTDDGCNSSMRLPAGDMLLIDEVTGIDRRGGPRGLGRVSAVKEIRPDDWYFACHFPGDPVMPGFMVLEGATQVLQVYALSLGLHLVLPDAEFQALPGRRMSLTFRGQVTPDVDRIRFEADITEITLLPRPTLVGDVTVYLGDQPITVIRDFGLQIREKPGVPVGPEAGGRPRSFLGRRNAKGEPALLNELHLAHFAKGDLAVAFGPEFEVYEGRQAIRLPNGDFQFVDRIMEVRGERGAARDGASSVMEYDFAADGWYHQDRSQADISNCVLMETSLQAAVSTGYLLGGSLETPELDLCLRNLGGRATLLREVDLRGRTLRQETELLSHQRVGDTLLQNYRYRSLVDGEVFYEGESLFGYFTAEAMAAQRGLDDGTYVPPWLDSQRQEPGGWDGEVRKVDLARHPRIPHLRMIDEAEIAMAGGEHGLGYLRGRKTIDPADWYFACHFHGDPVMPGSLGVEALYEGLQILTVELGLTDSMAEPVFGIVPGVPLDWKYRGQILPDDGEMLLDVHLKRVDRRDDRLIVVGDGSIWKPGLRIYEVTDIAVEVRAR
ncbi:hypothetical protein NE236_39195 [Actinoallomurus purpureus]|uniref:hypothetical protein n=1 Tax=Actinoallomurus purpureus TaxID=478114 RepID=UPI002093D4A7|nr:hypothetical protein [Actinoallomurus purpureus]MCO6011001.1 hypothetical protein [Actinoallomurus purpureus]